MTHPYGALIADELAGAQADVVGFRTRAIGLLGASSAVITLLTAVVTYAGSKRDDDGGISDTAIVLIAAALSCFVAAAVLALVINRPVVVGRPDDATLALSATDTYWDADDDNVRQRYVAAINAEYLSNLRQSAERLGGLLSWAIRAQIAGLTLASISTIVTMTHL